MTDEPLITNKNTPVVGRIEQLTQTDSVVDNLKKLGVNFDAATTSRFQCTVICGQCQKEGKKSKVTSGGCSRTLLWCEPFYDEEGRYHHHDSNVTTEVFRCSEGHDWIDERGGSCWCGLRG